MNSPERRDEQLERMLRQAASSQAVIAGEDCLDPETAAAWADGSLTGRALETAQVHAAGCGRCQALMATLLRTAPPDASVVPLHQTWIKRWQGWLVPAMAAAAAGVVWVAVVREPAGPTQESTDAQVIAPALTPALGRTPDLVSAAPPALPSETGQQGSTATAERDRENVARENTTAATASSPPPAAPVTAPNEARPERQALADAVPPGAATKSAADAAPGGALGAAASRPAPPPAPAPVAPASATPVDAIAASPPPAFAAAGATPDSSRPAATTRAAVTAARAADTVGPVVGSADPSVRWRLADGRSVERSTDGGVSWQRLEVPDGLRLRTGFAPSASVCWIVGDRGTVLRMTDGRAFQRIAFPEPLDLVAVTASSGTAATVVANGGRRFSTTDGLTWREQ